MKLLSKAVGMFLILAFSISANEIILQNNESYNGCEDGYLSALFETPLLQKMVGDSLTNHFSEPDIYVSK